MIVSVDLTEMFLVIIIVEIVGTLQGIQVWRSKNGHLNSWILPIHELFEGNIVEFITVLIGGGKWTWKYFFRNRASRKTTVWDNSKTIRIL